MTNKERLLQDRTTLEYLLTGDFWGVNIDGNIRLCKRINCTNCKFNTERTCACQRIEWLNAEHKEPLLFPIGTIVEVTDDNNSKHTGYYNGFENGKHYVSCYKHFLGCRNYDGELYGSKYNANQLRKVGEVND